VLSQPNSFLHLLTNLSVTSTNLSNVISLSNSVGTLLAPAYLAHMDLSFCTLNDNDIVILCHNCGSQANSKNKGLSSSSSSSTAIVGALQSLRLKGCTGLTSLAMEYLVRHFSSGLKYFGVWDADKAALSKLSAMRVRLPHHKIFLNFFFKVDALDLSYCKSLTSDILYNLKDLKYLDLSFIEGAFDALSTGGANNNSNNNNNNSNSNSNNNSNNNSNSGNTTGGLSANSKGDLSKGFKKSSNLEALILQRQSKDNFDNNVFCDRLMCEILPYYPNLKVLDLVQKKLKDTPNNLVLL
jgi:hypothetical protein